MPKPPPPKQQPKPKQPPSPKPEPDAASALVDKNPSCAAWASKGECERNPGYMGMDCAASCEGKLPPTRIETPRATTHAVAANGKKPPSSIVVDWSTPVLPDELATAQRESDERRAALPGESWHPCRDARPDCTALARTNLSACGEAEVMLSDCRKTCRTCSYEKLIRGVSECKDTHGECANWARMGECENNKRFMLNGCSVSCGVCASKKAGCSRRNVVPGVLAPNGLTDMFKAAPHDFPQYSPTFLSTPQHPLQGGPYILQFEDVVSEEEASVIIELARDKLERSLAGDQLSPVRTS